MLLQDLRPDVLVCTPSYALHIAEVARAAGHATRATSASRFGHFGGEPWTEDMRVEIERELGILAFNNYGLSEVIGPGVSGECAARTGMHIRGPLPGRVPRPGDARAGAGRRAWASWSSPP